MPGPEMFHREVRVKSTGTSSTAVVSNTHPGLQHIFVDLRVAKVPPRQVHVHLAQETVPSKRVIVPHRHIQSLTFQQLQRGFKLRMDKLATMALAR